MRASRRPKWSAPGSCDRCSHRIRELPECVARQGPGSPGDQRTSSGGGHRTLFADARGTSCRLQVPGECGYEPLLCADEFFPRGFDWFRCHMGRVCTQNSSLSAANRTASGPAVFCCRYRDSLLRHRSPPAARSELGTRPGGQGPQNRTQQLITDRGVRVTQGSGVQPDDGDLPFVPITSNEESPPGVLERFT